MCFALEFHSSVPLAIVEVELTTELLVWLFITRKAIINGYICISAVHCNRYICIVQFKDIYSHSDQQIKDETGVPTGVVPSD